LKEQIPFPDPDFVDRSVSSGWARDGIEGVYLARRTSERGEGGRGGVRKKRSGDEGRERKRGRLTRFKSSIIPRDTPINVSTVSHSSETMERGVLETGANEKYQVVRGLVVLFSAGKETSGGRWWEERQPDEKRTKKLAENARVSSNEQ